MELGRHEERGIRCLTGSLSEGKAATPSLTRTLAPQNASS